MTIQKEQACFENVRSRNYRDLCCEKHKRKNKYLSTATKYLYLVIRHSHLRIY